MLRLTILAAALMLAGCAFTSSGSPSSGPSNAAFPLRAKASREENLDLDLKPSDLLAFKNRVGDIVLRASADGKPHLTATITMQGRDQAEADELLKRYKLVSERSGADTLTVRMLGEPAEMKAGGSIMTISPSVNCEFQVPRSVRLDLTTGSGAMRCRGPLASCKVASDYGSVEVADVTGDVHAKSASGNVSLDRCQGEEVELHSAYGTINGSALHAQRVSATTGSGNVTLKNVDAPAIRAESSFGTVDLDALTGRVEAKSASGSVRLRGAKHGSYVLRSSYGTVEARDATGPLELHSSSGAVSADGCTGTITAKTSYGNVRIAGVFSAVDADSKSGSVRVTAQPGSKPAADWSLRSSYGAIELSIPSDFDCVLDAKTSYGSIKADAALSLERPKSTSGAAAHGTIGKGGAKVSLIAASGSIQITRPAK